MSYLDKISFKDATGITAAAFKLRCDVNDWGYDEALKKLSDEIGERVEDITEIFERETGV